MIARPFFVFSAVLLFANVAFGQGSYQRTKDGKTIIWNNDPEAGDLAGWWGDRDGDGYATGFGTLTWYKARSTGGSTNYVVYARYFGNMVRGKFAGPVNAHSKGKTAHANFVEGRRTSAWAAGTAPSRRVAELGVEATRKPPHPAQIQKVPALRYGAEGTEPLAKDVPAEGPPPSSTSAQEEALAPPDRELQAAQKQGEAARQENVTEPVVVKGSGEPSTAVASEPKKIAAYSPDKPPVTTSSPEVDNPLGTLTHPPSSLRKKQLAEDLRGLASASPRALKPRLTTQEVIDLADTEARSHGYDPAEYQRPEPRYDPTDETWSLLYEQKPGDGMVDVGKHFSVAIDDKTKNISVVPER